MDPELSIDWSPRMESRLIDCRGVSCLFLADAHLSHETPVKAKRFLSWVETLKGTQPPHLFILGDLFDVWFPGIERIESFYTTFMDHLEEMAATIPMHFLAGNRDFHLVEDLKRRNSKIDALDGYFVVKSGNRSFYVSHGDELCINDLSYQRYKRFIRSAPMISLAQILPGQLKRRIVAGMSKRSRMHIRETIKTDLEIPPDIYDVLLKKYDAVIHGHTHPPFGHPPGILISHVCVLSAWEGPADVLSLE